MQKNVKLKLVLLVKNVFCKSINIYLMKCVYAHLITGVTGEGTVFRITYVGFESSPWSRGLGAVCE